MTDLDEQAQTSGPSAAVNEDVIDLGTDSFTEEEGQSRKRWLEKTLLGEEWLRNEPYPAIKPYRSDLSEELTHRRLPLLKSIGNRYEKMLEEKLSAIFNSTIEVRDQGLQLHPYKDYLLSVNGPIAMNVIRLKPFNGMGLVAFDAQLLYTVVENMFGSRLDRLYRIPGRPFSDTEWQIMKYLQKALFEAYEKAWHSVTEVHVLLQRVEISPRAVNLVAHDAPVLSNRFAVQFAKNKQLSCYIDICLPLSLLRSVPGRLFNNDLDRQVGENDWSEDFAKQLRQVPIEIIAPLMKIQMNIDKLASLTEGDILPLDVKDTLEINVQDIALLRCSYGVKNGRYSLKLKQMIPQKGKDF